MKRHYVLLAVLSLYPTVGGYAENTPQGSVTDERVKSLIYNENQVYKLVCYYGYQIDIEMSADEVIKTIAAGDSLGWQIVAADRHLFIKPMANDAKTNLSVITTKRTYVFDLSSRGAQGVTDMAYLLRFKYPEKSWTGALVNSPTTSATDYNFGYTISGSKDVQPSRVFDDGQFTYFKFDKANDLPAIFLVGPHGQESLVNTRMDGEYVVVERVGDFYTLRSGKSTATVINDVKLAKGKV